MGKQKMSDFITIPLPLMTLNQYTSKQRVNHYVGNKAKRDCTNKCSFHISKSMREGFTMDTPVKLKFVWYYKNKRQDPDNIAFQKKFILDGMIKAKLIKNDGWSQITGFVDEFKIDKKNERVEIYKVYEEVM